MNEKTREPFAELALPRKELPKLGGRYRVYKDASNYTMVEAASALEAFKQSGLPQVHRIERDAIYLNNVLNLAALANTPPPATAPVETKGELELDAPVAEAAAPPAPPADPAPLSSGDVDKLLKGESATGA